MTTTIAEGIQQMLAKYGSFIEQYRGRIPASVVAARIWHETRGVPTVSHASTGEAGLLQLWPETQAKYDVSDPFDPAENIRAGCAHWLSELNGLDSVLSNLGLTGAPDQEYWSVAYLYTAIGAGATKKLLETAQPSPAALYTDLAAWVEQATQNGQLALLKAWFGTQSPESVRTRVKNAGLYVGAAFGTEGGGGGVGDLLLVGAVALGLWLWWRRR